MKNKLPKMRYDLIMDSDHMVVIERINELIDEGWIPIGGVISCNNRYWVQAVYMPKNKLGFVRNKAK